MRAAACDVQKIRVEAMTQTHRRIIAAAAIGPERARRVANNPALPRPAAAERLI